MANHSNTGSGGTGADPARGSDARRPPVLLALQMVEEGERDSLEQLREALCGFVSALRKEGVSREGAVGMVADIIRKPAGPDGGRLYGPAREALVELSTHWCAGEYAGS